MENGNKSFLTSFRRVFRSSSTRREKQDGRSSKRKLVFPEDNEKRYEDVGDFTSTLQHERHEQKPNRKAMYTLSESRKVRPNPPSIRSPTTVGAQCSANITTKSATLPPKKKHQPSLQEPIPAHTIRIPPPRQKRKLPISPDHTSPVFSPRSLPHTMSTIDFSTAISQQYKTAVNISRTGPTTLPHDYSEPYHWLATEDETYSTISSPTAACKDRSCNCDTGHKYTDLQVSASMVELRSNSDYMEINRSTLDEPTIASDYQQPIALRGLPGPPTAVKQRQQRREEKKLLRGTIVVLDENKTLEV